jgi:hypothetical protein
VIRPYRPADFEPVNDLWRRARIAAFPEFQARKGHTAQEDRHYFRTVILVESDLVVADEDGRARRRVPRQASVSSRSRPT